MRRRAYAGTAALIGAAQQFGFIALDARSQPFTASGSPSYAYPHTIGAASNRLLLVSLVTRNAAVTTHTNAVRLGGSAGTLLTKLAEAVNGSVIASLWYLPAPSSGTQDVYINVGATVGVGSQAVSLSNVSQGTPQTGTGTATSATAVQISGSITPSFQNSWVEAACNAASALVTDGVPTNPLVATANIATSACRFLHAFASALSLAVQPQWTFGTSVTQLAMVAAVVAPAQQVISLDTKTVAIAGSDIIVLQTWTPADLPSIVHWWHAVDSTKTGSPGDISQLNDRIGAAHLTQVTGTAQPDDNTRTINGKVALDFDGGDTLTTTTDPSVSVNGTVYGWSVVKIDTLVDADFIFATGGFTAGDDGFSILLDNGNAASGRLELNFSNGTTQIRHRPTTPVVGTTNPHLVEFWIIGTTGEVNLAIDGTDATAYAPARTTGYGGPDDITIMARVAGNQLDGAWCEAGLCTAVPNSTNRAQLLAYAQAYWGVT
jgi:hypothetical protein